MMHPRHDATPQVSAAMTCVRLCDNQYPADMPTSSASPPPTAAWMRKCGVLYSPMMRPITSVSPSAAPKTDASLSMLLLVDAVHSIHVLPRRWLASEVGVVSMAV